VVAHSGASVRPKAADREALEAIATGKELTRLVDRDKADAARGKGDRRSNGIFFSNPGGNPEDESEEDDEEGDRSHRVVEDKKLTKTQRNKLKKNQEREKVLQEAREEKARLKQINRTGEFQKEISKEDASLEKKRKEAEAFRAEMAKTKPKKLGRHTYQESRPEVKLAEEVPENLRQLEVEGNLFRDRFQSMQKRNIIEPREIQKNKRRYKLKVKHYINTNGTGQNGLLPVEPMSTRQTLTQEERDPMQEGMIGGKKKKKQRVFKTA